MTSLNFQLGKKGLTPEFIENLKKSFDRIDSARVRLLKNSTRDKEELEKIAEGIVSELGPKFTYKIIGFTIILKKWRKAREKG